MIQSVRNPKHHGEMKNNILLALFFSLNFIVLSNADMVFKRKRRRQNQDSVEAVYSNEQNNCNYKGLVQEKSNDFYSSSDEIVLPNKGKPLQFLTTEIAEDCFCYELDNANTVRFAYLIIVHDQRTIEDAVYAFRSIAAANAIITIHIDKKLDWGVFLKSSLYSEINHCRCGALIYVDQKFAPEWAEWSMNSPTLWAMEILTSHTDFLDKWDTFINLSGDTIPTRTPNEMSRLFHVETGPLSNTNFVTSSSCTTGLAPTHIYHFPQEWHKRTAHSTNPEGHPSITYKDDMGVMKSAVLPTYFGSQWVILTYSFVDYIAKSLRRNDSLVSKYRDALILTGRVMTDETFIPSLVMHVSPESIPKINNNEPIYLSQGENLFSVR